MKFSSRLVVLVQYFIILSGISSILLSSCARSVPRETLIKGERAEFELGFLRAPFSTGGIPIIECSNVKGDSWRFLIDTGSAGTIVSKKFAEKKGNRTRSTLPYTLVGGRSGRVRPDRIIRISELRLGSAEKGSVVFRGFDAFVVDSTMKMLSVDGLLGLPLFSNCLLTIDYSAKALLLEHGALKLDSPHTISFRIGFDNLIYVPIEVAGQQEWALFDTGCNGELSVPEEHWENFPITNSIFKNVKSVQASGFNIGGVSTTKFGRLQGFVNLVGHKFKNPLVTQNEGKSFRIGSGLLGDFKFTIDQRNRLMSLSRVGETE